MKSATSSALGLRHGTSTLNSQVPQKVASSGLKNKHFQPWWQHGGFTVPTSHRSTGDFVAWIFWFVLSRTIHPGAVSASQPARHKTSTSFLFHYKFKIYLQNIKSKNMESKEENRLFLSLLSVNLFGGWEVVRWQVFSPDLLLSDMDCMALWIILPNL